jgi:hypothetical protein
MRDLDALLNSLINIDLESLVAILSSESEAAHRLVNSARQRTEVRETPARAMRQVNNSVVTVTAPAVRRNDRLN